MNVIKSFDFLKVSEVFEFEFEPEFEFEFEFESEFKSDHRTSANVEVENTSQIPILKTNRKKIDSNQSIDQSENSSISKSIESNESEFLNRIIQSKKLTQKINKSRMMIGGHSFRYIDTYF